LAFIRLKKHECFRKVWTSDDGSSLHGHNNTSISHNGRHLRAPFPVACHRFTKGLSLVMHQVVHAAASIAWCSCLLMKSYKPYDDRFGEEQPFLFCLTSQDHPGTAVDMLRSAHSGRRVLVHLWLSTLSTLNVRCVCCRSKCMASVC
jgi:hypothetical protein